MAGARAWIGRASARRFAAVAAALVLAGPMAAATAAGTVGPASSPYGFATPDAAAVSGNDLFVANRSGDSLTEIDATTGRLIARIDPPRLGLAGPDALVVDGADLFVANRTGASVSELTVAGRSPVRVVSVHFAPIALAADGRGHVWVLGASGGLDEISAATGQVLASGHDLGLRSPAGLAYDAGRLWVTDRRADAVTVVGASTLRRGATLSGRRWAFSGPDGIVAHGEDVWVADSSGTAITEVRASATPALVQTVPNTDDYLPMPGPITFGDGHVYTASPPGASPMVTKVVPTDPASLPWMMCNTNGPYTFSNPEALVVHGPDLWVVNEGGAGGPAGNSLTEMDAATGALIQVLRNG